MVYSGPAPGTVTTQATEEPQTGNVSEEDQAFAEMASFSCRGSRAFCDHCGAVCDASDAEAIAQHSSTHSR